MKRRFWKAEEEQILRQHYPHEATWRTARRVRRPVRAIYQKAVALGLAKTDEYLASPDACRLRRGDEVGKAYRFKPGLVPANKGLRRPGWAPGRMRETQFKKGSMNGHAAAHYMPRNTLHRYPKDIKRAIWARGALNRRINRMEREHGQHA